MPKPRLRIAEEFSYALAGIYSQRVLSQIKKLLELLCDNPEMGSKNVRESVRKIYGDDLCMIPVSKFAIVYRYSSDTIDVLALVYGPTIV